jgi:hypothetical protein
MAKAADALHEEPIGRRLRAAGAAELLALVRERIADIDAGAARLALRNPHLSAEVVATLLARRGLLTAHAARHRPRPAAPSQEARPGGGGGAPTPGAGRAAAGGDAARKSALE